ncbi:MAG: hypothetical protein R3D55_11825 [Chloroflexota bacterium]
MTPGFRQQELELSQLRAALVEAREMLEAQERRWRLVTSTKDTGELDRSALFLDILTNLFSEDELITLCFELGIDYELLPGSSKLGKAREIIKFCDRRGLLKKLHEKVRAERPYVFPE